MLSIWTKLKFRCLVKLNKLICPCIIWRDAILKRVMAQNAPYRTNITMNTFNFSGRNFCTFAKIQMNKVFFVDSYGLVAPISLSNDD